MLRLTIVLAIFVVGVWSFPAELPEPGDLALVLNEDDFEDYLDQWLEIEEIKRSLSSKRVAPRSGCTIHVNDDLGNPQPVCLRHGSYLDPTDDTGEIHLRTGDQLTLACTGSGRTLVLPQISGTIASSSNSYTATCVNGTTISGAGWLYGQAPFSSLVCNSNAVHEAQLTSETCYNNSVVIRVGFVVDAIFYPLYYSCFDQNRLEVLYTRYEQRPPNVRHQTSVARPGWQEGGFYPSVGVDHQYTQVQQKLEIARYVGDELADKYVTSSQYLARGHLACKTDFIYATGQRASFYYINAAPQWQPFNAGNWNSLEQNLRARIAAAGYNTMIYTGTFGVSQLRDQSNRLVDIYLYHDENNNPQLPVPLYFYKIAYEPTLRLGTAFVSINNPYYTEEEVHNLTFCTDLCRNNTAFDWLRWQPDRIEIGYSFCCYLIKPKNWADIAQRLKRDVKAIKEDLTSIDWSKVEVTDVKEACKHFFKNLIKHYCKTHDINRG